MMIIEVKTCGERTQKSVKKLAFESLKRCYDNDRSPVKAVAIIVNRFDVTQYIPKPLGMNIEVTIIIIVIIVGIIFIVGSSVIDDDALFILNEK